MKVIDGVICVVVMGMIMFVSLNVLLVFCCLGFVGDLDGEYFILMV